MKALAVVGGGGHAKVVVGLLLRLRRYHLLGYTDPADRGPLLGLDWLGGDEALPRLAHDHRELQLVLGLGQVGTGERREQLWLRLRSPPVQFPPIVSPESTIGEAVSLAEAAVVMDGAVVNPGATIGRGAILNTNCTVEHDAVIDDWVHVAPGAIVCGGARVGRFSMIGAGATVIEAIRIGERCFLGAGTTVVRDISEPGVYVGSPARRLG